MKKFRLLAVVLCFAFICGTFIGCGNKDDRNDDEVGDVSGQKQDDIGMYSVKIDNKVYSVDEDIDADTIAYLAAICEEEFTEEDELFPAAHYYINKDFEIRTWMNEKGSGENSETIWFISTGTGETERGIAVGAFLKDVREAYPELAFISGSLVDDNGEFMNSTRKYRFYDENDGTNNYLDFWFARIENETSTDGSEWAVTGIEAADALDMSREWDKENSGVLGEENIHIEMPDGFTKRIFRENNDGSEEEIKYFKGAAESVDLDNDGISELICYGSASGYRNIVILDIMGGEITETDVNSKLGCRSSDYAGLIGNINSEYRNCIAATADADGIQTQTVLYDYKDGELVQRCDLEEALR